MRHALLRRPIEGSKFADRQSQIRLFLPKSLHPKNFFTDDISLARSRSNSTLAAYTPQFLKAIDLSQATTMWVSVVYRHRSSITVSPTRAAISNGNHHRPSRLTSKYSRCWFCGHTRSMKFENAGRPRGSDLLSSQ